MLVTGIDAGTLRVYSVDKRFAYAISRVGREVHGEFKKYRFRLMLKLLQEKENEVGVMVLQWNGAKRQSPIPEKRRNKNKVG